MKTVSVGLIGMGTIGSGVAKGLKAKHSYLKKKLGIDIQLKTVCEKRKLTAKEKKMLGATNTTSDAFSVATDPDIDILVELIGGTTIAKDIILEGIKNKKHIVTANKALLAEKGKAIYDACGKHSRQVKFEASVAGGIPIIKSVKEAFAANQIEEIYGILNGTSNYILTLMEDTGCSFSQALKDAQLKGYAEKDPSFDIDGIDTAHKIAILTLLAFDQEVGMKDIYTEGIRAITAGDISYAKALGCSIKLLAIAKKENKKVEVRVHPTLVPRNHPLSSARGAFNAVFVKGDMVGDTLFFGQGAGEKPTASAVLADIIDLAKVIASESAAADTKQTIKKANKSNLQDISQIKTKYYIRFQAVDAPGVLSQISKVLGEYNISISSVLQQERNQAKSVPVIMISHDTKEQDLRMALKKIDSLKVIKGKSVAIRMEKL